MATSGSTDFTRTRDQIIRRALRLVTQTGAAETPSGDQLVDASEVLNMMVKAWQAQGLHLWTQTEGVLFLAKSAQSYQLGPTGDHATESYVQTTLTADATGGATALTVDSISGILNADQLGIELDDGTLQWTTVSGAPAGSTVTAAAGLDSAASSGNAVFAYTTKLDRPLRVLSARLYYLDGNEIPLEIVGRETYMELTNKSSSGKAVQVAYSPQLTNGRLYVWPTPDDVTDVIKFTFTRPLEDFDTTSNTPDFPAEWLEALSYGLAVRIAPEYGLDGQALSWLKQEEALALDAVLSFDQEWAPIRFEPEMYR